MGGQHSKQGQQKNPKFVLKVENQKIILHPELKLILNIGDLQVFPHGLDGLKLWDAGIILSRYIIKNNEMFKDKDVLELGSGVGIGGLTAKKWTQCKKVIMTDYHPCIIDNINKNCLKNDEKELVDSHCNVIFDWKDHMMQENKKIEDKGKKQQKKNKKDKSMPKEQCQSNEDIPKFDIIMGSDIVYFGCPVEDLYQVFKKCLKENGRGLIIIPDRKNYAQLFSQKIQEDIFGLQIQQISDEFYHLPVLQNEAQSLRLYSLLGNIKFYAYHLIRKPQQKQIKQEQDRSQDNKE